MAGSENVVPRDSRIEPLQFRYPESRFRYCPGRNFSEKLEVIRVNLLKYSDRAGCPYEVNAARSRIILDVVCTAHAVKHLNHFSGRCIHDHQLAGFMLVPAANIAGMGFGPAAHEQAMMGCIQASGVGHRTSGDWPLCDHRAFFKIDYCNMAVTGNNISHGDVQCFSGGLDSDTRGITAGELDTAHQFACSCVDYVDRS